MDVPGIDALLHDYHYGVCNAGVNLKMKWQADWLLAKGGERKGKGSYSSYKFVGLTIATLVFTPYSYFKRRTTKSQKLIFSEDYSTLCLNSIQHMLLATLIDKLKVL
jgi:hypothetical protein